MDKDPDYGKYMDKKWDKWKSESKIRLNKIRKSIGLAHNINFISVR